MENNEVKENQNVNEQESTDNQNKNSNENKEKQESQNTSENKESNESRDASDNQETNESRDEPVNEEECEDNQDSKEKGQKEGKNYSVNLAILGGVVGAGIGLLANPETSKKVIRNLGESELVKTAGKEFKKTAQELLTGQAQNSVKQIASGYISKFEEGLLNSKKDNGGSGKDGSSGYQEIKEENKQLNERLDKIEKMLSNLVESK